MSTRTCGRCRSPASRSGTRRTFAGSRDPAPDAAAYADLYSHSRRELHAVAPSVEAILGGLSPGNADGFLSGVYASLGGVRGTLDAVAVHPYAKSLAGAEQIIRGVRTVLDQHGDVNVPLDVSEFGWPTRGFLGDFVTDQERAWLLSSTSSMFARSDCGIERVFPYTWTSSERDALDADQWFGIVNPDGSPTAGGLAYANELGRLHAARQLLHASQSVCRRSFTLSVVPLRTALLVG